MAEADDFQMYEQQVEAIQQANQPILDGFEDLAEAIWTE